MKKVFKSVVSVMLVMLLVFGSIGTGKFTDLFSMKASAATYYPDKAIAYAAANWNNGVGQCAEFVSNCLTAGGVSIMQKTVSGLKTALSNGGYGTLYKLSSSYTQWGQVAKMSDNQGKVKVGDPLFTYCTKCGLTHAVICGGTDSSGYITIYAHNSAKNNQKYYADCTSHDASYIYIYSFSMNVTHTHNYNSCTTSPAYCESQGYSTYSCACGASYTEYVPALGHDYSVRSYYESAHPHYAVYKCSRCEKTTVNYSEVSPNEECLTCPPVSAIDLVVTPGTSSTETVITWNPRPSLVSSYSEYYKFLLCIYDSNGKIVKMKEEPCKLTNIRPNVSFVLPSGYYTAELDTVKNNDYANAVSISTTFYVAQGETKYTLTYNANGGSGVPSSQTGSASYTVTSTKPTRNGYTFLGWSKSGNASYASYTAGDTITLTSDTTLYAVWQKNVTYYSCRYCGHSFTSESECNSHQLECNSKPTTAVPDVEYSYCPICGEKFENEIECDEHAVTCGQKTCINCGEIFANETEYNAHLANCRAQNGDDNSSTGIFGLIISFFANIFSIIIMVITLPFTLFF